MNSPSTLSTCQLVCWGLAAFAGLAVLIGTGGEIGWIAAILVGAVTAVLLAIVGSRLICTGDGGATGSAVTTAAAATGAAAETAKDTVAEAAAATEAAAGAVVETTRQAAEATKEAAEAAEETLKQDAKPATELVKGGTVLSGEEELAGRKGAWKYGEPGAPDSKPATPDYDGDGVTEGENEGRRPEGLDGARDGKADDLKAILGIGPKLEKLLNEMGFYHFDQIAAWSADEVAWVNANLKGFKGRVTRDKWISQAKTLAAGGKTAFSKRVEDGEVY